MQWRLTDRITDFQPWRKLCADKAVSLEEYYLKERLGQPGEMPESLLLEACVQAAQWLVVVSSDFTKNAMVEAVVDFTVKRTLLPGEQGNIVITVKERDERSITVACSCHVSSEEIVSGEMALIPVALAEHWVPGERKSLWREIFRTERG